MHGSGRISRMRTGAATCGRALLLELDDGALGMANMFDLDHHTLRFTQGASGYKVENVALQWDSEFGPEITGANVPLKNFKFPFSGKEWDSLSIGCNGSIRFGSVMVKQLPLSPAEETVMVPL